MGLCQRGYLDACGFAPSPPATCSWPRPGQRTPMPEESPRRRRSTVLALDAPDGPAPFLDWHGRPTQRTSEEVLGLLAVRKRSDRSLRVSRDHASFHHSLAVQAALPALWKRGGCRSCLPPCAPERNRRERRFGPSKHHDLPERADPTLDQRTAAGEAAVARQEAEPPPPATQLALAA